MPLLHSAENLSTRLGRGCVAVCCWGCRGAFPTSCGPAPRSEAGGCQIVDNVTVLNLRSWMLPIPGPSGRTLWDLICWLWTPSPRLGPLGLISADQLGLALQQHSLDQQPHHYHLLDAGSSDPAPMARRLAYHGWHVGPLLAAANSLSFLHSRTFAWLLDSLPRWTRFDAVLG